MQDNEEKVKFDTYCGFKWKSTIKKLEDKGRDNSNFHGGFKYASFFLDKYKRVRPYSFTIELVENDTYSKKETFNVYGESVKKAYDIAQKEAIEWSEFHSHVVEAIFVEEFDKE